MKKLTEKQQLQKTFKEIGIKFKVKSTLADLKEIQKQTLRKVNDIIEHHEKHKNSYFWTPPQNASSRRSEEQRKSFSVQIGKFMFISDVSCSCKNYYYRSEFIEGSEKKNLRCFKKLQTMLSI